MQSNWLFIFLTSCWLAKLIGQYFLSEGSAIFLLLRMYVYDNTFLTGYVPVC